MVLRDVATILHSSPVMPRSRRPILGEAPDLLTPDDIRDTEIATIVHDPLGNFNTRQSALL